MKTNLIYQETNREVFDMIKSLRGHWPEYLMETWELGTFMLSACIVTVILEHPDSPVRQSIGDPMLRRVLIGIAMGLTAVSIIYSPWGKQSGAHFNPSVTLTFLRLGKVKPWDAVFYIIAQFIGGAAGVITASLLIGNALADPSVNYAATVPGMGAGVAFIAEISISFALMTIILIVSNTQRLARYTGIFAGILVATYISVEAPFSGMSMNPARTFGSALSAGIWTDLWVYFTAPPLGMLLASEAYLRGKGNNRIMCAKLHHENDKRCIHCGKHEIMKTS